MLRRRAVWAMLRVGFSEAVAYRAEMLVWILATTMPLIMLALWHAVADAAPIGRYNSATVTGYFLSMFVVRILTGSWIAWLINSEVRDGTLGVRLMRPVHPLFSYAVSSLAELPVRSSLALPLAVGALVFFARSALTHDPVLWTAWCASILGGWLITVLANLVVGTLALLLESSSKVMDVWFTLFFVLSGYIVPIDLFPSWARAVVDWLPFRYQLGLPVEIMTGAHARADVLRLLLQQLGMVGALFLVLTIVWRRGISRYSAFGG